jgi:LacI family transcriptional regulator
MVKRLRIALLIESFFEYGRGMLRGIADYSRAHGGWSIRHQPWSMGHSLPSGLCEWRPQGIIAQLESEKLLDRVRRLRVPVVDLFALHSSTKISTVIPDHAMVARLAAEHLLDRGLIHFAYCGLAGVYFSERRAREFSKILAAAGHTVDVYEQRSRQATATVLTAIAKSMQDTTGLAKWLQGLPKPVGIMVCDDIRAQQLINVCRECEIAVPEEVAVVGVGNDEVLCDLCDPPLTSVELSTRQVGYEAAALLDRMIHSRLPAENIIVPPLGVVTRRSTDLLVIPDPDVHQALQLIRSHACEGLTVDAILQRLSLSRSTLQRRFKQYLGRSPHAEIARIQLLAVRDMLKRTDLSLTRIAQLAGFSDAARMCNLFKEKVGCTPGQYRKAARAARM